MTTAIRLYELLEAAEREGFNVPSGTASIRTDTRLILHIADETGLDAGGLYRAFFRRPVRQTYSIVRWARREAPCDLEEQSRMIACWSQRELWRLRAKFLKGVA